MLATGMALVIHGFDLREERHIFLFNLIEGLVVLNPQALVSVHQICHLALETTLSDVIHVEFLAQILEH